MAAQQRETPTTAQLKWRLLGLAKTIIVRLSHNRGNELPAQRVVETDLLEDMLETSGYDPLVLDDDRAELVLIFGGGGDGSTS